MPFNYDRAQKLLVKVAKKPSIPDAEFKLITQDVERTF
jgi:hypothetical protein